jgi:hypothetical protein
MALSAALGAALALAAGPSPASAAPLAIVSSAPVVQSTARGEDSVAVSRPLTAELARQEIFEILCGGVLPEDSALAEHLWQVAGSLARRAWTPPRVTVRSVVSASEASRR